MEVKGNLKVGGTLEGITFTDGVRTFSRKPQLNFDVTSFYLDGDSHGNPTVILRPNAGSAITVGDGTRNFTLNTKIGFNGGGFYLSGDSNGQPVVNLRAIKNKTITIEFPGSAEDITVMYTSSPIKIRRAKIVLQGSASPSLSVSGFYYGSSRFGTDNNALAGTQAYTSTTFGQDMPLNPLNPTIPINNWISLTTSAQSGTVNEAHVTMDYEEV
jgi:hypothetical protein